MLKKMKFILNKILIILYIFTSFVKFQEIIAKITEITEAANLFVANPKEEIILKRLDSKKEMDFFICIMNHVKVKFD